MYPVRMVIMSGTFPIREQVLEFRRALRKRSLSELEAMFSSGDAIWGFRPPEIERRKFTLDGKEEVSGWEPYTEPIVDAIKFYLSRAAEPLPEDQELLGATGVINKGLVMARPPLARGEYPKTNLTNLMSGAARWRQMFADRGGRGKRPPSFTSTKLSQRGIDVFNPTNPIGTGQDKPDKEEEKKAAEQKPEETDSQASEGDDLSIPEFALVRFIDATIEPGYMYQYKIKIKMDNPNYGKHNLIYPGIGKEEEIAAPEFTMTPKIAVPSDTEWYVIDDRPEKDRLYTQIHHWVEKVLTDKDDQNSVAKIGDWTISEKCTSHRGEYIGRVENVRLATWNVPNEIYQLAINARSRSNHLPVDFAAKRSTDPKEDPALLLDYSGGKAVTFQVGTKKMTEEIPVEALVLAPDGKLIIRRQQDDFANAERESRLKSWKEWMAMVILGRGKKSNQRDIFNRQMLPGREGTPAMGGGGRRPG
jgi:hypothetical protein